jgi:uncharacterized protein (DUF1778 family)
VSTASRLPPSMHAGLLMRGPREIHAAVWPNSSSKVRRWYPDPLLRRKAIDKPVPKWHHLNMAPAIDEPRKRITARVSDSVRNTLEQAAELLGANVNQFIVQTAYLEAQRVIECESVIRLSQKDAQKVLALLDNSPKANKRLKDAVRHFKGAVRA